MQLTIVYGFRLVPSDLGDGLNFASTTLVCFDAAIFGRLRGRGSTGWVRVIFSGPGASRA